MLLEDIPADESHGGDKEKHIDALVDRAKTLLGTSLYHDLFQAGLSVILDDIKEDLEEFGVSYQEWFSERQLIEDGSIQEALKRLDEGFLYEKRSNLVCIQPVRG